MGSDEAKIEKKRLKAQVKAEKARAKAEQPKEALSEPEKVTPRAEPLPGDKPEAEPPQELISKQEKEPWYKDPHWIKAIAGLATLVVMIITLALTLRN